MTRETADVLLEYIQRNIPEGVSMSVEQTELVSMPQYFELPPQAQQYLTKIKTDEKGIKTANKDRSRP